MSRVHTHPCFAFCSLMYMVICDNIRKCSFYSISSCSGLFILYSSFFVGAEVNVTDEDGSSPLHWAAIYENFKLAELLLQKGEFKFLHFQFSICCIMMAIAN